MNSLPQQKRNRSPHSRDPGHGVLATAGIIVLTLFLTGCGFLPIFAEPNNTDPREILADAEEEPINWSCTAGADNAEEWDCVDAEESQAIVVARNESEDANSLVSLSAPGRETGNAVRTRPTRRAELPVSEPIATSQPVTAAQRATPSTRRAPVQTSDTAESSEPSAGVAPTPSGVSPTGTQGEWVIQLGAFVDPERAEQFKREQHSAYQIKSERVWLNGRTFYVLFLDGFASRESAQSALRGIRSLFKTQSPWIRSAKSLRDASY